jgi:peptidoglycan hydrolase CwlO-like protein
MLTGHLNDIYQHLQGCVNGLNACKHQMEELHNQNKYSGELIHEYEIMHRDLRSRNMEHESKIAELEGGKQEAKEAKEALKVAMARISELEGKALTNSRPPQSPEIAKRPADPDMPSEPEKRCGRHRKQLKLVQ